MLYADALECARIWESAMRKNGYGTTSNTWHQLTFTNNRFRRLYIWVLYQAYTESAVDATVLYKCTRNVA